MKKNNLIGIVFDNKNGKIIPSVSFDELDLITDDINIPLKSAELVYNSSISKMKEIVLKNIALRKEKKSVPAILMWNFGNEIFKLIGKLSEINFRWDNLYESLIRDLGVSDTTLERVITFRRYVPDINIIPDDVNWGALKGSPKKYLKNLNKK